MYKEKKAFLNHLFIFILDTGAKNEFKLEDNPSKRFPCIGFTRTQQIDRTHDIQHVCSMANVFDVISLLGFSVKHSCTQAAFCTPVTTCMFSFFFPTHWSLSPFKTSHHSACSHRCQHESHLSVHVLYPSLNFISERTALLQ